MSLIQLENLLTSIGEMSGNDCFPASPVTALVQKLPLSCFLEAPLELFQIAPGSFPFVVLANVPPHAEEIPDPRSTDYRQ
jgi:hypothetical protein